MAAILFRLKPQRAKTKQIETMHSIAYELYIKIY